MTGIEAQEPFEPRRSRFTRPRGVSILVIVPLCYPSVSPSTLAKLGSVQGRGLRVAGNGELLDLLKDS